MLEKVKVKSCPTLCDPVDCSLPGSSVHGILQARILEWVAITFSRGSSRTRDWTGSPALQADASLSEPWGKPQNAEEAVDKREPSCTAGGNVNWYSHYGEQ